MTVELKYKALVQAPQEEDDMATESEIAREMLKLEETFLAGGLSPAQTDDWLRRASKLFGHHADAHPRKSSRIPADHRCTIQAGKGSFVCHLDELSLVGLTVSGPVFGYVDKELPLVLRSVEVAGRSVSLDLPCKFVNARVTTNHWVAGLSISTQASADAWQTYFRDVYYPVYLARLKALAGLPTNRTPPAARKKAPAKKPAAKAKRTAKKPPSRAR